MSAPRADRAGRVLRVATLAALALGAIGIGTAAIWRVAGGGTDADTATALGMGAWLGAAACAIWRRKRAADDAARRDEPAIALARSDWEPPTGIALSARAEQRPVALAPLEAALVCGVAAPHAVAALLAELSRSGLVQYEPGDPPVLTVGRVEPAEDYGRLLARASGEEIGTAAAMALASHAAEVAGRKLAAGGRAASAAYYAACWAGAATDGGSIDAPCDDPLGRPPASRALARDLVAILDPALAPATPWVKQVAARLAASMAPVSIEALAPVMALPDAGLHTAAAGGAVVGFTADEGTT